MVYCLVTGKGCVWPLVLELETDLVEEQGKYNVGSCFVWPGVSFVSIYNLCMPCMYLWLEGA